MQLNPSRLREARLRRMLTQDELAARAGTTEATVNRLENGLQRPRISTVRKLAAVLGVMPEDLIDWESDDEGVGEGKAAA
jgi:transcriptional regulator with XRE-family HTH domain